MNSRTREQLLSGLGNLTTVARMSVEVVDRRTSVRLSLSAQLRRLSVEALKGPGIFSTSKQLDTRLLHGYIAARKAAKGICVGSDLLEESHWY